MAYCGILDGLMEINGEPVDLSRLDEGIVIAGDETIEADELITNEDRLAFFNDGALRTKKDLLAEIDSLAARIAEESKSDTKHSPDYYSRYSDLVRQFRTEVEKKTFPEHLEDWWEYRYEIWGTGISLFLSHIGSYDIYANDTVSVYADTEFELFHIRTKLLTVEQYAKSYGVTTTAVRQWIRRGKLRSAIKQGSEWRIPELAEVMDRGYKNGSYTRKEYLTDLPAEYAFFNEYDYVEIDQNRENKELFDVDFGKDFDVTKYPEDEWEQFHRKMQMDQKEREKFELYLISSPFVESNDSFITSR